MLLTLVLNLNYVTPFRNEMWDGCEAQDDAEDDQRLKRALKIPLIVSILACRFISVTSN